LVKEAKQLGTDAWKELPPGTLPSLENHELLKKKVKNMTDDYTELYNQFADPKFFQKDEWPFEFFDLPPKIQEAKREFRERIRQSQALSEVKGNFPKERIELISDVHNAPMNKEPITVAVTGAAGAIGYSILFKIASGQMFGPKQPVNLQLLELPQMQNALKGVEMELDDCAFPTLRNVVSTDRPEKAFEGVDYAILVGAQPRTKGMERGDLLLKNAEIFITQGKALNVSSKKSNTRVLVVGNPANTNTLICQRTATSIPPENFQAMMRLDHNRALAQISEKTGCRVQDIERFIVWGNHSATQYPDLSHALIKGELASHVIKDKEWISKTFIPTVQQRGAAIITARGASSAASAGSAAVDQIYSWHYGTGGEWMSAAVYSDGEYGVTKGLFYSYPVVFNDKKWAIVRDLPIDQFSAEKMEISNKELKSELDAISHLVGKSQGPLRFKI